MGRYVGILCHAESIPAKNHAMKVFAVPARCPWTAVAIVVKKSGQLSAANAVMRDQVSEH